MSDLYPTLLRDEKSLQFGATLQNIVSLEKRDEKMSKKLVIVIDGDKIDPVEYSALDIKFEGDSVIINVTSSTSPSALPIGAEDAPSVSGYLDETPNDANLSGQDLAEFTVMSEFRLEENKCENSGEATKITLESKLYDIQDMSSIQNACFDLVELEREYIKDGYKISAVADPLFVYETTNNFKLVETTRCQKS